MQRQRERARAAGKFKMDAGVEYSGRATEFRGYDTLALEDAKVAALYREGTSVPAIRAGEAAIVVLDKTPFYAESGGQVGDAGEIVAAGGTFIVSDTQKIQSEVFGHHGALATGRLAVGDRVMARVDAPRRARTMRNHSATHLMHKALREVLGRTCSKKARSWTPTRRARFFARTRPQALAQRLVHQMSGRVIAPSCARAAARLRAPSPCRHGEPAGRERTVMAEHLGLDFLRVGNDESAARGDDLARVAHLATRLGVERRLVQHDDGGFARRDGRQPKSPPGRGPPLWRLRVQACRSRGTPSRGRNTRRPRPS